MSCLWMLNARVANSQAVAYPIEMSQWMLNTRIADSQTGKWNR